MDDNPAHRDILRRYLDHWGVGSASAAGPIEALERLQAAQILGNPFQLAILDLAMPQMDGFALAEAIRRDPALDQVSLVLLTAFDQRGQDREALGHGFSAYLTKPVKHLDLLAALQSLVGTDPGGPTGLGTTRASA